MPMKITRITSHLMRYELEEELGFSQAYFTHRTCHLVEVETDEGVTGGVNVLARAMWLWPIAPLSNR